MHHDVFCSRNGRLISQRVKTVSVLYELQGQGCGHWFIGGGEGGTFISDQLGTFLLLRSPFSVKVPELPEQVTFILKALL